MPEIAESARRWSGYVCPDCRFVFRVPRDHDGVGLVCPSCRRMLRLPRGGEAVPALTLAVRQVESTAAEVDVEDSAAETAGSDVEIETAGDGEQVRRRKKRRSRKADSEMAWEHHQGRRGGEGRRERGRMRWMLGGGLVLVLGICWWVVTILGGSGPAVVPQVPVKPSGGDLVDAGERTGEGGGNGSPVRSDAELLAEAETVVTRLMEAESIPDLLELVHRPERTEERMRSFYPAGVVEPPGLGQFERELYHGEGFLSVVAQTRDFEGREVVLIEGPDGLKVDWESFVGWSEMAWADFIQARPVAAKRFRVILSEVNYYNFEFADETRWRSYALKSPDGEHVLYGYVERDSLVDQQIRASDRGAQWRCLLELAFPEEAGNGSQVRIGRLVAESWVEIDAGQ